MGRNVVFSTNKRRMVAALLISAMATVAAAETASAQTGNFTCRASVLRLESPTGSTLLEPVASNRPNDPCVTDSDSLATLTVLGTLQASLLQSSTTSAPGGATSNASVASVTLATSPGISADVAESEASARCSAGAPVFSGSSRVVNLQIGGRSVTVLGTPNQRINLPLGLGFVVVNQEIVTADRITRRALFVSTPLLRVVVAESIADVHGNPCAPPDRPECSDGIDNDGDGNVDFVPTENPFHPRGDRHCSSPDDDSEAPFDI
jgi:hypothetical protein